MSSLFSDPPFTRGTTLLAGADIELVNGAPVAGAEIVGSVKAFRDIHPYTGQLYSNRLVYCVAARYTGAELDQAGVIAARGVGYVFATTAPLTNFSAEVTQANVAAGLAFGVLDSYLTGTLRPNDIVWLVIDGPCEVAKASGAVIAVGAAVEVSATAGRFKTAVGGTSVKVGQNIVGAQVASETLVARVNLFDTTANVAVA